MRSIVLSVAALCLVLSGVAISSPAQAASLTENQIQAILSLLSSFGADSAIITNVHASLRGQPMSSAGSNGAGSSATAACPAQNVQWPATLSRGARGDIVIALQKFFVATGYLSPDSATGYYGVHTEAAVKKWQADQDIVSSGSPETTGWGVVGLRTRTSIWANCVSATTPAPMKTPDSKTPDPKNVLNFTAHPTSGQAPLTVSFLVTPQADVAGSSYYVDFGDGQEGAFTPPLPQSLDGRWGASYTYTVSGTYQATLHQKYACSPSADFGCPAVYSAQVDSVTITVR